LTAFRVSIVIDLGFGDSGKGITVDYLCAQSQQSRRTIVARFAGGHQVGHTVKIGGVRHTFSNFGSGTLRGIPSYYHHDTTCFPPGLNLEYQELESYRPQLFLNPYVMVTTPYDIAFNRALERLQQHGSCGVGYGATVVRNQDGVRFYCKDIDNAWVARHKLQGVCHYYHHKVSTLQNPELKTLWEAEIKDLSDAKFLEACQKSTSLYKIAVVEDLLAHYDNWILEGNQGVLLDAEEGIYPHNSYSRTLSSAAFDLVKRLSVHRQVNAEIFYVSRCYQTRHGTGPMSADQDVALNNAEDETNCYNIWQGHFRVKALDPELLNWSLRTDRYAQHALERVCDNIAHHLVITCLDQRPDFNIDSLIHQLTPRFGKIFVSYSAEGADLREYCTKKT
jgi:adenylosuccinate synthase